MSLDEIYKKLIIIENILEEQNLLRKDVLNLQEGAKYLDISESYLYKLTSTFAIPCYKPNGKKIYFNRKELDEWLLSNRQMTKFEIESKADNYLIKNRVKPFNY